MTTALRNGLLLAETFEKAKPEPDPTGWWVSEKLDGMRTYWDGSAFYSRNNIRVMAPDWFTEGLPRDSHLDGELWCGREQFEKCVGIIKYQKGSTAAAWKELRFLVFDAPCVRGDEGLPYEERHAFIETVVHSATYAKAVSIRKCEGLTQLTALLREVCSHGAEGLMLRRPGSLYERRRSKSLLKVKTFMDAEARVVGHVEGKNRLTGHLGALRLEMPCTQATFEVGTGFTDADRRWGAATKRWPVGTVVTYKCQNLTTKGVPRFPVFLRDRRDKTWEEVVADAQMDIDDKAVGGGEAPAVKRQPSLMASALVPHECATSVEEVDAKEGAPRQCAKRARVA